MPPERISRERKTEILDDAILLSYSKRRKLIWITRHTHRWSYNQISYLNTPGAEVTLSFGVFCLNTRVNIDVRWYANKGRRMMLLTCNALLWGRNKRGALYADISMLNKTQLSDLSISVHGITSAYQYCVWSAGGKFSVYPLAKVYTFLSISILQSVIKIWKDLCVLIRYSNKIPPEEQ